MDISVRMELLACSIHPTVPCTVALVRVRVKGGREIKENAKRVVVSFETPFLEC